MIPLFPHFKKIDIDDASSILKHTKIFKPYSDFNFTNLYAWDTKDCRSISELNGNLVVLFTDYLTNEPSLSFLGTNNAESTALQLIEFSKANNISSVLRFITEETARALSETDLCVEEDVHNFDYVYSVHDLANLSGSLYKEKRILAKRFIRDNPQARIEVFALHNTSVHKHLISVLRRWQHEKIINYVDFDLAHEEKALRRLIDTADHHKLIVSCVFIHDTLIGFGIDEIESSEYAMSHFIKADVSYKGIYEYINEQVSKYLESQKVQYWNWQQDLNLPGLRKVKNSYRPITLLKKYTIALNEDYSSHMHTPNNVRNEILTSC